MNVNQPNNKALVVDVDGTLIRTDLLHESVFALLKKNPLFLFMLPLWLLRGKAHLKQEIARRADVPASLLPYRDELVEYLREQKAAGRRLVLATASNERYAQGIAEHLGIFDDALGSDGEQNLSGARKLARVQSLLDGEGFAYAGNASVDVPIWEAADAAVIVDAPASVARAAARVTKVEREFKASHNYLKALIVAMRPHQWMKNVLIFVPLVVAQMIDEPRALYQAVLAFMAFSACASSVYLLNDLLDLSSDRQHPSKRFRPFAAGDLPISLGVVATFVLLAVSFVIAYSLPPFFLGVLCIYYVFTMAYSLWLKRAMFLDALVLAGLYTMRLIAGAAAIEVVPSFWLLAFSIFIFLSLALIKRYSELVVVDAEGREKLVGRAYQTVDMETIVALGAASGYLAVLVMAFYINSEKVFEQYQRPEMLWLLCPMMLYWISRMWFLTRRGDMHDDPIVFTIKDRRTYSLGLIAALVLFVADSWSVVRQFIPGYFL